jgi:hypothetical protein
MLSGGGVVVDDSADSSPRVGTSDCLEKYALEPEHRRSLEMGGIVRKRSMETTIRQVKSWYHDQVGVS